MKCAAVSVSIVGVSAPPLTEPMVSAGAVKSWLMTQLCAGQRMNLMSWVTLGAAN
jgi:hypothetical protein